MGSETVAAMEDAVRGVKVHFKKIGSAAGSAARGDLPTQTRILNATRALVPPET